MRSPLAATFAAVVLLAAASAQGTQADYQRALSLRRTLQAKVDEFPRERWLADGTGLWYARTHRDGRQEFTVVDAATGTARPAFDTTRCAAALKEAGIAGADPERLPVELEEVAADGSVRIRHRDKRWRFTAAGELRAADDEAPGLGPLRRPRPSRNGGGETSVTFINATEEMLRLVWLDAGGQRHDYGEVASRSERAQHTFAGHVWLLLRDDGEVAAAFEAGDRGARAVVDGAPGRRRGRTGPPRRPADARGAVRDHNVVLTATDGSEVILTADGRPDDAYREPLHWSPDRSRLLVFQQVPAQDHEVTAVESSPRDQVQPKVHTFRYLKPGDRIARPRPRLFDVAGHSPIAVAEEPFADAWSIDRVHWAPDGSRVYLLYNRRGHQVLRLCAIDAATGAVSTVLEERSDTFVDYSQKTWLHWLDGTNEALWASERDGWNHLYRVDLATGALQQITRGEFVVRGVDHVDAAARQIWFTAYGVHPDQDPYHAHLCRVGMDGEGFTVLTQADGTHEWSFAPDRRHFVARWSRVDHPRVSELRRSSDGALVCELGRDDPHELLAAGWRPPERFVAKGRDGKTDIHGIVIRPMGFDPARRYPVIEAIYAGPHGFHVPKAWGLGLRQRALAELGFLVVQIDGMGTNWRSRSFHDVCWRNLKDAGFPDRIAWLRAAAAVHPELDLSRVGIFGGSAGGQNALAALLHHGDFYRAAAADCGCHDNRMDKIWWNEAWMGWPVGEWYADSSNVTHAGRLQGKLLLTVGELDRNVDPASTLQVVDALIRADKDFEFVMVPGAGHGIGESPYLVRRRMDFFVRSLLGVEPRAR